MFSNAVAMGPRVLLAEVVDELQSVELTSSTNDEVTQRLAARL
jgi:hypothetical protein